MLPVKNIIKGHVNELLGLNIDLTEQRMQICKNCPLYSSRLGGICNDSLYINPETDEVSTKNLAGYVRGCGCRLKAKTSLYNEECPAKKW